MVVLTIYKISQNLILCFKDMNLIYCMKLEIIEIIENIYFAPNDISFYINFIFTIIFVISFHCLIVLC